MYRLIGELTNMVLFLTETIFSNLREGKGLNVMSNESNSCSEMVTEVHNPQQMLPRPAPRNGFSRDKLNTPTHMS